MAPSVSLRLVADNGENVMLTLRPEEILTLDALLALLRQLNPAGPNVCALEYEDDEGDLVTVTNDEEVQEMMSFASLMEADGAEDPLLVFPKATSGLNNIHNLTLSSLSSDIDNNNRNNNNNNNNNNNCSSSSSSNAFPNLESQSNNKSVRQPSADLGQILSQGQISFMQLEYSKLLGKGNSGTVYHAVHKASRRSLAVKVIRLENPDSDTQSQIISELHSLHQCNSNFIIAFYGAFFRENCIHICTEYMDGGSLDQYGAIPEMVLRPVAVSMIQGLHYLWSSLKIMHRDVKPSNVLVNTKGEVKLCDFGVSIQLEKSIAKSFVGTNAYMSPERIQGVGYGMSSDIWSLGLSLLEMILGRFPFPRPSHGSSMDGTSCNSNKSSTQSTFHKTTTTTTTTSSMDTTEMSALSFMQLILHQNPDMPSRDSVTPEFYDLLVRTLQRDPANRISSTEFSHHPFFASHEGVGSNEEMMEIVKRWIHATRTATTTAGDAADDAASAE